MSCKKKSAGKQKAPMSCSLAKKEACSGYTKATGHDMDKCMASPTMDPFGCTTDDDRPSIKEFCRAMIKVQDLCEADETCQRGKYPLEDCMHDKNVFHNTSPVPGYWKNVYQCATNAKTYEDYSKCYTRVTTSK